MVTLHQCDIRLDESFQRLGAENIATIPMVKHGQQVSQIRRIAGTEGM